MGRSKARRSLRQPRARIESQLFEVVAASGLVRRERKPLALPRLLPRIVLPKWRWAYSAVAAAVIVVLLIYDHLCGRRERAARLSVLSGQKLATEEAWLWVAPARDEPALHLRFAQRRLDEYTELAERGVYDESLLDAMVAHVDAALDGIEGLPPAIALELLDEAAEVVAEQQRVLTAMLADLPAASRPAWWTGSWGMPFARSLASGLCAGQCSAYEDGRLARADAPTCSYRHRPNRAKFLPLPLRLPPDWPPKRPRRRRRRRRRAPSRSGGTEPGEPTSVAPTATPVPPATDTPPPPPPPTETPVDPEPTKKTPPGLTKTPLPPGQLTKTPNP